MHRRDFLLLRAAAGTGPNVGPGPVAAADLPPAGLSERELLDPVGLTIALCNIPSVSGDEGFLADLIFASLARMPHLELTRVGATVVARTTGGHDRRLIVAGHLDTVPIADNLPVKVWDIQGVDTLFGRGVADMKSGLAVMLSCVSEPPPGLDITWIFYDGEEVGGGRNGLGRLERERPDLLAGDLAVLCEPTDATVELGCKGSVRATVTTKGRAAHAARDWMGVNAIDLALPVLTAVETHEGASVSIDGLVYRECLNVVQIAGGSTPNVIPERCEVTIAYRFAPDKSVEDAKRVLLGLLPGFEVEFTSALPGARPEAAALAGTIELLDAPVAATQGLTDVARFAALGIPALNYGPGASLTAHAHDEQCPAPQIRACAAGLRRMLGLAPSTPVE
jgi:succinyl-diaminopimelate desuccinylase